MGQGPGRGRRRAGVLAAVLLAGAPFVAACGSAADQQPTVASVNFDPKLVVVADGGGLDAETGPREGARELDDTGRRWQVEVGSVIEVHVEGDAPQRVVADRTALGGGDPSRLLDTGDLQPGDAVTVALTEVGDVTFRLAGGADDQALVVVVVPRT